MGYNIVMPAQVKKYFDRLPSVSWRLVRDAIDRLANNPRPPGSEKMKDSSDAWRIRVGDYRILYTIEDDRLIVLVVKIGHRSEVYR